MLSDIPSQSQATHNQQPEKWQFLRLDSLKGKTHEQIQAELTHPTTRKQITLEAQQIIKNDPAFKNIAKYLNWNDIQFAGFDTVDGEQVPFIVIGKNY